MLSNGLPWWLRQLRICPQFRSACAKLLQSCQTLCDPMVCSPPGSSVHGILQTRILEWVAMPSSRGYSWPRDQTCVSHLCLLNQQEGSLALVPLRKSKCRRLGLSPWVRKIPWRRKWLPNPEMATMAQSRILAWIIPRTKEPGRLQSLGSQRVGHDWATFAYLY